MIWPVLSTTGTLLPALIRIAVAPASTVPAWTVPETLMPPVTVTLPPSPPIWIAVVFVAAVEGRGGDRAGDQDAVPVARHRADRRVARCIADQHGRAVAIGLDGAVGFQRVGDAVGVVVGIGRARRRRERDEEAAADIAAMDTAGVPTLRVAALERHGDAVVVDIGCRLADIVLDADGAAHVAGEGRAPWRPCRPRSARRRSRHYR